MPRFPQAPGGLDPAKDFFEALANLLIDLVAIMPGGSFVDGQALGLLRHIRCCLKTAQPVHKDRHVIPLISADGDAADPGKVFDHLQSRLPFGGSADEGKSIVHRQAAAVLHQGMAHVAELGLFALALFVEPAVGVGSRLMRVIFALLPFEIDLGIATTAFWRPLIVLVFGAKALHRGPSFDQSAIDREMFFGQQPGPLRLLEYRLEEGRGHFKGDQTVPARGKGRMIPDLVIHGKANEPAKQQIVFQLFDQLSLATDRIEHLQQKRP